MQSCIILHAPQHSSADATEPYEKSAPASAECALKVQFVEGLGFFGKGWWGVGCGVGPGGPSHMDSLAREYRIESYLKHNIENTPALRTTRWCMSKKQLYTETTQRAQR